MIDLADITLEEFQRRLDQALRQAPTMHRELLQKAGELVLDRAAEQTPEVEGRLKASYERRTFQGEKEWELNVDGDTVEAGSNVYYARMVEEGHAKPDEEGFVEGKHYFRKGFEQAENEIVNPANEFFEQLRRVMRFD